MHVLSELRNPLFEPPDRQRALRALQLSRLLRENNLTKPWVAIKSMIDKVVGENIVSRDDLPDSMSYSGLAGTASRPKVASRYPEQMPSYSTQQIGPQPLPPQPMQPIDAMDQNNTPFNWDDLNFSNIVGDAQPTAELPEFDFVSPTGFFVLARMLTMERASGAILSTWETSL
jgi:hypothetical protein